MRVALIALALASPAAAKEPIDYGPQPSSAEGVAMIEQAFRDRLRDPDSAKFEWPNSFVSGWYRPTFGKKYVGWITCGTVNAKNAFGGYVGRAAAIGVIKDGQVIAVNMDDATARSGSLVAETCRKIGVPVG